MGTFIKGIGIISPQQTHDGSVLTNGFAPLAGNRLTCSEPDYGQFIDAKQIRRMSRIIKMGVVSSLLALRESKIEKPDSVIVGTAFGCLEDTNSFLSKMVQYKEEMLSPTAFIHSTHNTIAAQVALWFQCRGYNSTYVHKNISFESALLDSMMLLEEGTVKNVLTGGVDEIIDASFTMMNRMGFYKKEEIAADQTLYEIKSKGSFAGEGAAFFSLVNSIDPTCIAEIKSVKTFSFSTMAEVVEGAQALLSENKITTPDLVLAGFNGDIEDDKLTTSFLQGINCLENSSGFKHWCGEYGTSSAFALWLAACILKEKSVPESFSENIKIKSEINNILIYNHQGSKHHSLIVVTAC